MSFVCLPINLARHFSRARLCCCFWCPIHPVSIWWRLTLELLRLLFHFSGWAEAVQDYVLVLFPVASLWVWSECGITLKKKTKVYYYPRIPKYPDILKFSLNWHQYLVWFGLKVLAAGAGLGWGVGMAAGASRALWRWLMAFFQLFWVGLAGQESPWLERALDNREPTDKNKGSGVMV